MSRVIRVDAEVYELVLQAKAAKEAAERYPASMSDGVRRAINAAGPPFIHEHASWTHHEFGGTPCALGLTHRGCCPGREGCT